MVSCAQVAPAVQDLVLAVVCLERRDEAFEERVQAPVVGQEQGSNFSGTVSGGGWHAAHSSNERAFSPGRNLVTSRQQSAQEVRGQAQGFLGAAECDYFFSLGLAPAPPLPSAASAA